MKKLYKLMVIVLTLFVLVGCEPVKIQKGFRSSMIGTFSCGVKSDTVIFDADNIELDFYFGINKKSIQNKLKQQTEPVWDDYYLIGFGVYYYAYQGAITDSWGHLGYQNDYQNVQGGYFLKFIPAEDFLTENYAVSLDGRKIIYNHNEFFTVPKVVLASISGTGRFYFSITSVYYSDTNNNYSFDPFSQEGTDYILLSFSFTDTNTVKIK